MNRKGQLGLAFLLVLFMLILVAFATIDPLKGTFDSVRGYSAGLNCPGTPDFNQTAYSNMGHVESLTKKPTCFATGLGIVWFIGAILVYGVIWVYNNWRAK